MFRRGRAGSKDKPMPYKLRGSAWLCVKLRQTGMPKDPPIHCKECSGPAGMAEAEVFPAATSKEKDGDSFLDL